MRYSNFSAVMATLICAVGLVLGWTLSAGAHCDGLDGPVVTAARRALETGNADMVLVWVQESDELHIREMFQRTLEVRKLGAAAQELADGYFFETVVRVHRAGEGEPFTGLKPAGRDLGLAIPAADKALEVNSVDELTAMLSKEIVRGIKEKFESAVAKKAHAADSLDSGRDYVSAYVVFLHYVEGIYNASVAAHDAHSDHSSEDEHGHSEDAGE